jgi:predicted enzyme related to lactoylglutathione lyase
MLSVGDIHIYVHDFKAALRFWSKGLGLKIVEREQTPAAAFALLDTPAAGPAIHLIGGATPWPKGERPETGARPEITFDIITTAFDDTLVRALENGGRQDGEIEDFNGYRGVTIIDPDGNSLALLEVPEEDEEADEEEEEE